MSRYVALAAAALLCFVALGRYAIAAGEPALFVGWERALFDRSTLVAWWLTWGCYADVLLPLSLLLLALAWRYAAWRARLIGSVVSLLVAWRAADFSQHLFHRARPIAWVVKHERSFSYPSSHAAIAAAFYGLLAVMLLASSLPRGPRIASGTALLLLALAICWSRLALGAHYLTDLIGGALLGLAVGSVALGVVAVLDGMAARRRSGIAE